jgi:hypothetical protein
MRAKPTSVTSWLRPSQSSISLLPLCKMASCLYVHVGDGRDKGGEDVLVEGGDEAVEGGESSDDSPELCYCFLVHAYITSIDCKRHLNS